MPQPLHGVAADGGRQVALVVFLGVMQIVFAVGISLNHGKYTSGPSFQLVCKSLRCSFWLHSTIPHKKHTTITKTFTIFKITVW